MKIGIYVEHARDARPTGIGLHIRNLLDALAALDHENEYLLYYPYDPRMPRPPESGHYRPFGTSLSNWHSDRSHPHPGVLVPRRGRKSLSRRPPAPHKMA